MLTDRRKKQLKKAVGIFLRRYPWQIHFQFETLRAGDAASLLKFILSGKSLKDGQYIASYEKKFAGAVSPEGFAFSFGSGRMALYAILDALGIGEGDEVILPAFTCEVVVNALLYRKIRPVYADIEMGTLNIDAAKLDGLITARTKAIVAQHTFGVACDMDAINALAKKRGIHVIEDCAVSLGSSYKGRAVGTLGDAAIFSTDRTKITSTLSGGVAFTMNKGLAGKIGAVYGQSGFLTSGQILNFALQMILALFLMSPFTYFFGQVFFLLGWKLRLFFWLRDDKVNFRLPIDYPYPCRLSNLQAMLGLRELERLGSNLALRRQMVRQYVSILKGSGVPLSYSEESIGDITLRFSLLLKDREAFVAKWMKYFDVGQWFDSPAIGWYENLERIGYVRGSCPTAEFVHKHIVNFPTHQRSDVIRNFLYMIASKIKPEDVVGPAEGA